MTVDILHNGKKLEIVLDPEGALGDLLEALADRLKRDDSVIVLARLDGEVLPLDGEDARLARRVGDFSRLEIESQNTRVLVRETIEELAQYLDRVARLAPQMTGGNLSAESVDQLVEGLGWCVDVLSRVETLLGIAYREIESDGEKLHKIFLRLGDLRDHISEATRQGHSLALESLLREATAPLCDTVVRALPLILAKADLAAGQTDFLAELEDIAPLLSNLPERLEQTAVKISIGDTTRGMEDFAEAVTTIQRAVRAIDAARRNLVAGEECFMAEGRGFEERSRNLSQILEELIGAFEKKDRVLIGDLIEYEIAPETKALSTIIEQVLKNAKHACH